LKPHVAAFPLAALLLLGGAVAHAQTTREIFEIQGNGMTSPYVGAVVSVPHSVVTAVVSDGFFLQTPDSRADTDNARTSNGIRVVTSGAPTFAGGAPVMVGHLVNATGTVAEVGGETRLVLSQPPVGLGTALLPRAAELSLFAAQPRARPDNLFCAAGASNFECFEGMRITIPAGVVAAGSRIDGIVHVSPFDARSMREKGVRFGNSVVPGNGLAGIWDGNPEILMMNPGRLGAVATSTELVGGARISATGVLAIENGAYTLWPTELSINAASNVLPVAVDVPPQAATYRVATFDLDMLCDSVAGNTPQPCRSPEPNASEVANQIARLRAYIVEVLRAPDIIAVQGVENQAVLDALASSVSSAIGGTADWVGLMLQGSHPRGHNLGFLVRIDRISGASVRQLGAGETWNDPSAGGGPGTPVHTTPPLLLSGNYAGNAFRILNIGIVDRTGVDSGATGARERRFAQAESIAYIVQTLQRDGNEVTQPVTVLGKFNGWSSTDGYVDVVGLVAGTYYNPENIIDVDPFNPVSPILVSILKRHPEQQQITAMTLEQFGAIQGESNRTVPAAVGFDDILLTFDSRRTAMDYAIGRGNADAPATARLSGTGAVGSSRFDGLVVEFDPACISDPTKNQDGDDWCDTFDNCPFVPNNDQRDSRGLGFGDACNPYIFRDGFEG
jgi:uncharacterized protein